MRVCEGTPLNSAQTYDKDYMCDFSFRLEAGEYNGIIHSKCRNNDYSTEVMERTTTDAGLN